MLTSNLAQQITDVEATAEFTTGTVTEGVGRLQALGQDMVGALPSVGVALVVFGAFVLIAWCIRRVVAWYAVKERKHNNLAQAVGRLAYGLTLVIGLLIACVIVFPNFTPTSLLTSLGVGSLVLGLAFKEVLQNYLAGILLLVAEPFRPGDQIVFKDFEGTVEDIQTRATFVRTYDGRRVVIPNAELFTNSLTVNTAFEQRRVEYDVGIGYGDDLELAKRLILEAVRETDTAVEDPPPEVLTYELAASTVNLRVRWWIQPPKIRELLDARDQVLAAIKVKLQQNGIDLPFDTTQILFHDQTEDTDGDRARQREGWPAKPGVKPPQPYRIADAMERLRANGKIADDGSTDVDVR